jgi:riboflavin biosynthesis pyrimidine reductase
MLDVLGRELGIRRLLPEGGGINGSFFAAGLVDELSVIIAPALDGQSDGRAIFEEWHELMSMVHECRSDRYCSWLLAQ